MAKRTFAENVAQVKADFKAVKDAVPYVFNDNPPTSEYGERIFTEISSLQYQADSAWNQGFNNGMEQGRAEGIEQGKQEQRLEWWGKYLNNGKAIYGYSVFGGYRWNDDTFDPPYDINLSSSTNAFAYTYIQDLKGILQRNGSNLIFNESGNQHFNVFANSLVTYVPYLKLPTNSTAYGWFSNCTRLKEVDGYECCEVSAFESGTSTNTKTFYNCTELIHILFYGTIAKKLDIHWSKKLDRASILSLLTCLNATVSGIVITLPSMCIDGATDTLAMIQADTELNTAYNNALAKGYTISFV
jgi:hypothetical protein